MQKISTALLLRRPGSHLPFLLADQDLATLASVGMVEGRGDLGWLSLGWGSQGFPRQGKGSRRCARGGMQPKPPGCDSAPVTSRCRQTPGRAVPWGWTPAPASLGSDFGHRGGQAGPGLRAGRGEGKTGRRQPGRIASCPVPLRLCLLGGWQHASST